MSQVNPPGFLRKIIPRDQYTEEQLNFLDNLIRSFEQLYRRTGGSTDLVAAEQEISDLAARLAQVEYELRDDPLTWDVDSFTWDSTNFTFDMDKA